jgi:acyl-CoA reductase-like NAD-dependent aldehyde dehydrogenase
VANGEKPENTFHHFYLHIMKKNISAIPVATSSDVDQAIAAAYHARETMTKMPKHERGKILENVASFVRTTKRGGCTHHCARVR